MTITTLPVAPIEAPASGDRFSVPAHHFRVAVEAGLRAVDIRTQDRRSAGGAIHGALALDPHDALERLTPGTGIRCAPRRPMRGGCSSPMTAMMPNGWPGTCGRAVSPVLPS